MRVVWSPLAINDLERIADYIQRDNPLAARIVVQTVERECNALNLFPLRGRPSRMAGRFDLVFAPLPYLAVYRVKDTQVEILRIYHTAQNWP